MTKIFGKLFVVGLVFVGGFWLASQKVSAAADLVDVSFGVGFPIQAANLAPGDVVKRDFTVTKKTKDRQILMMKFDRASASSGLERKILVKIKRKSDGRFLSVPFQGWSSEKTLRWLYRYQNPDPTNGKAIAFDTLSGSIGKKESYELWFTFDPRAGNAFQNKKTVFDLSVGIFSTFPGKIKPKPDPPEPDHFFHWPQIFSHWKDIFKK
jgi:hypothetical protein